MFSCVIFDFDMTLVDSSYAIRDTMNILAKREGLPNVSREDVLSVIGLPIRDSWVKVWGRFDERWLADYREMFVQQEFAGIFPFPGTKRVLETLKGNGVALGIASNRQRPEGPLKAVGLESYFGSIVGMDDVEKGKPAPDMILKGMTDLGGMPATTLYVGDTDDDMIAAKEAGIRSIGLTTGNFTPEALHAAGAWRVYDAVEGILPVFEAEGGRGE